MDRKCSERKIKKVKKVKKTKNSFVFCLLGSFSIRRTRQGSSLVPLSYSRLSNIFLWTESAIWTHYVRPHVVRRVQWKGSEKKSKNTFVFDPKVIQHFVWTESKSTPFFLILMLSNIFYEQKVQMNAVDGK